MKYDYSVEVQFKKFSQLPIAQSMDSFQLDCIKRYMQNCYAAGYAQGYADRIYNV